MRVFITGASGHIGSAVVPELLNAGHEVTGLARSEASAHALSRQGARVHRGHLDDVEGLRTAAADADGVIHLAFKHEEMRSGQFASAVSADMDAVQALGDALAGTSKPFVISSAAMLLAQADRHGDLYTEADAVASGPRVDAENAVVALADRGVRSGVVRLPPITHSDLDRHGFAAALIGLARQHGFAAYVGDGANRWPSVHSRDAARLYRLALEAGPSGGRWHAVADEGVPFKQIADVIAEGLGVPSRPVTQEQAGDHFSFLAPFVGLDVPVSSQRTCQTLGWQPAEVGLLADLRTGHYMTAG